MKTVLVTGSSGKLGAAISARLLEQGFRVIGLTRSANPASLSSAGDFYDFEFDLNDLAGIPRAIKAITEDHGNLFGLVNNAAIGAESVLATMHSKDISRALALNLQAPIELTKHAIRGMLLGRQGRVVNITSVVAQTGYKGLSVYAATKSGLEGFSKSLARETGKRGVTVNCIAPGFMPTAMTAGLGEDQMNQIKRRTPIGRLVSVEEVAAGVGFLLSDAGAAITGKTITIDGGASS